MAGETVTIGHMRVFDVRETRSDYHRFPRKTLEISQIQANGKETVLGKGTATHLHVRRYAPIQEYFP